jgi:hypothetical protein
MKITMWSAMALALLLSGCATPPPVKQSVAAMDKAYADNARMMGQYRSLVNEVNERYEYWYKHVTQRGLLNLALAWIATDPAANRSDDLAKALVDAAADQLGPALVQQVNALRFPDLPERAGAASNFAAGGDGDVTKTAQALPRLVRLVNQRVDEQYAALSANDLAGFDAYAKNVAALRQINASIRDYLDVDVQVEPRDVSEIAQAIRSLR